MTKKEHTTSIGFEEKIWKTADKLRDNLDATESHRLEVLKVLKDLKVINSNKKSNN